MAKAKPKRRQRPTKDEMTFAITTKKLEGWEKTRVTGITWLGYCFVSYMIYLSISELAGKVTTADMKLVVDGVHTSSGIGLLPVAVSILFGIGGIRYGLRQRKLRCDAVERLHPYQAMWEKQMDPQRESSTLTRRGETRPEDV